MRPVEYIPLSNKKNNRQNRTIPRDTFLRKAYF